MSRLQYQPPGKTIHGAATSDLDQKLTYQQLLKLNHDLAKQNLQLKNIGTRLGNQLKSLHTQFEIKPRQQNTQLYKAIGTSPELHQFEATLVPLLEAYQNKIQQFQHGFETIHQEFFTLEKKFEEVCQQNEQLKANLTDKSKQLIQVYRNGISGSMQADFGHLILEQINEKQKLLVEQNQILDRNYQKSSSEAERLNIEVTNMRRQMDSLKQRISEKQISERQLLAEVKNLKQSNLQLQIKNNQLESEKRKLYQAHERAQSLNNQLNKDKDFYMSKLQQLRKKIQLDRSIPNEGSHSKIVEQLRTKIAFLEAEKQPNDHHLKLTKLQKQFDKIKNQKKQLKQAHDNLKLSEQSTRQQLAQYRQKIRELDSRKSQLQVTERRMKTSLDQLASKCKNDVLRAKKQNRQQMDRLESDYKRKLSDKDRRIMEIDEELEKIRLQRDKLDKQMSIYNGRNTDQNKNNKNIGQNDRALNKMKEKLKIHEDFFKEQTEIYEQDLKALRSEYDSTKFDNKSKAEQLKKLKAAYEELQKQYNEVCTSKQVLIEEFKNVRDQYELNLKDKQRIFDEKIKQVKLVVEQSQNKRRQERQRVQEASKKYKQVLQDIKKSYESRIRQLQSQVSEVEYRRQVTYTPGA